MKVSQASISGAATGFLLGCSICLVQNIAVVDSTFRIFVLTMVGAWIGVLLVWLDQLLPSASRQADQMVEQTVEGRDSNR